MSSVSWNAGSSAMRAGELSHYRSRGDNGGSSFPGQVEQLHQSFRPVAGLDIDEAGVGRVGVFGHPAATQVIGYVFGQVDPGRTRIDTGSRIGEQLIDSIDAQRLRARMTKHPVRQRDLVCRFLGCDGAFVAIAVRIGHRLVVFTQPHIVHRPAVHGNRRYAFRRRMRGFAQAFFEPGKYLVEGPAQRAIHMNRPIGNAVDEIDLGAPIAPAQQRYAAALGAEIDGDAGARLRMAVGPRVRFSHRRNASGRPPSTGMRWPDVQRERALARNRIASAQSTGSMG